MSLDFYLPSKESTAVGEGDASLDHPSSPNCCSTPLRDEELPDNTDHSNWQYLYRHPDLPEQKQEEHQSQSDDVVTLIAEEVEISCVLTKYCPTLESKI